MEVLHHELEAATKGHGHVYDLTTAVTAWWQIVLVECDLEPRRRRVALSFIGSVGGGG